MKEEKLEDGMVDYKFKVDDKHFCIVRDFTNANPKPDGISYEVWVSNADKISHFFI